MSRTDLPVRERTARGVAEFVQVAQLRSLDEILRVTEQIDDWHHLDSRAQGRSNQPFQLPMGESIAPRHARQARVLHRVLEVKVEFLITPFGIARQPLQQKVETLHLAREIPLKSPNDVRSRWHFSRKPACRRFRGSDRLLATSYSSANSAASCKTKNCIITGGRKGRRGIACKQASYMPVGLLTGCSRRYSSSHFRPPASSINSPSSCASAQAARMGLKLGPGGRPSSTRCRPRISGRGAVSCTARARAFSRRTWMRLSVSGETSGGRPRWSAFMTTHSSSMVAGASLRASRRTALSVNSAWPR